MSICRIAAASGKSIAAKFAAANSLRQIAAKIVAKIQGFLHILGKFGIKNLKYDDLSKNNTHLPFL